MSSMRLVLIAGLFFFAASISEKANAEEVLEFHQKGEIRLSEKKRSNFEGLTSFLSGRMVPVQCALYLKKTTYRGYRQVIAECRGENSIDFIVKVSFYAALFSKDSKLIGVLSHSSKREPRREGIMKSDSLLLTEAQAEKVESYSFVFYEESK